MHGVHSPERLSELAIKVAACQANVPQVAIGELRGQPLFPRALPPQLQQRAEPDRAQHGSGRPPRLLFFEQPELLGERARDTRPLTQAYEIGLHCRPLR
jgi:hypothetical protein